jgi:CHC2-type zinc finger protein
VAGYGRRGQGIALFSKFARASRHIRRSCEIAQSPNHILGPPDHNDRVDCDDILWRSVNLGTGAFQCFSCGGQGNQLDLWMAFSHLSLYEAALDLANRLVIDLEQIRKDSR